jgi:gamma-tubulin complex component 3
MAVLVDSAGDLRGGALASCLEGHLRHGDPMVQALVSRTLRRVCVPLVDMLHRWVYEGELDDPHGEFFVADVARKVKSRGLFGKGVEEGAWQGRHELVEELIPRFLPRELSHQLFVLGKALHFMRRACGDATWVTQASNHRSSSSQAVMCHYDGRSVAEAWVGELRVMAAEGAVTHARLVELMMKKFLLRTHLAALKKFLLLGQGDFVVVLMDALREELNKPSEDMYRHSLTGIVDGALRNSNAQYEPPEVLERLGVKLLQASPGDKGWEVFSLDYKVDAPLTAVITPQAMVVYRQVFHLLWRLKRADMVLGGAWRLHMMSAKLQMTKKLPRLISVLHDSNLVRNRMWHLLQNLSNYMMFEVLEESWAKLMAKLDAASDLDALIVAHEKYLETVKSKALLSSELAPVAEQLHCVIDIVIGFGAATDTLFQDALSELARLDAKEVENQKRDEAGEWCDEEEEERYLVRVLHIYLLFMHISCFSFFRNMSY